MTSGDLERIEAALALRLPDSYRADVVHFPISEAGNADTQVWDGAEQLIELNRRARESDGWPDWLYAIGQAEGDPSGYAIDTRGAGAPVWWLDHMRYEPSAGPVCPSFADWFARWAAEAATTEPSGAGFAWFILVWLGLAAATVAAVWVWAIRT